MPTEGYLPERKSLLTKGPGGFTILELVVLIAVIGLALAIALPRLAGLERAALKSDAGRLSTLLRYAGESAATKRLYYKVSFDIENGSIIVERSHDGRDFSPGADIRGFDLSSGVVLRDLVVEGLGKIESGTVSVVFTPLGAFEEFSVHLEAGEDRFTVKFNPYSGRPDVVEGYA